MNIYNVPEQRRYWLVRADGSKYYDHFVRSGVIAVGHLNLHSIPSTDNFLPKTQWLKELLINSNDKEERRKQVVLHGQVRNFVYGMKEGDWVVTVGSRAVRVGLITSTPIISNSSVVIVDDAEKDKKRVMKHTLRRQVKWAATIPRGDVPYGMAVSLRANQTVTNLDKHSDAIYHTLYSGFRRADSLYLSMKITSDENISNHHLVKVLSFVNDLEVISSKLSLGESLDNYRDVYTKYVKEYGLSTTTKAKFFSKGDLWSQVPLSRHFEKLKNGSQDVVTGKMLWAVIILSFVFGNDVIGFEGIVDFDGVINKESLPQIKDFILDLVGEQQLDDSIDSLKLKQPQFNTLELESLDHIYPEDKKSNSI